MGYEIVVAPHPDSPDGEAHYFGPSSYVTHVMDWIGGLPESDYPVLAAFGRGMETDKPTPLAVEIGAAMETHPPHVEGLDDLLIELADTVLDLPDGTNVSLQS